MLGTRQEELFCPAEERCTVFFIVKLYKKTCRYNVTKLLPIAAFGFLSGAAFKEEQ
jgi:hypothetical protein